MRRLFVLFAVLEGCVRPDLVDCHNGTACPASTVCDLAHGGCVAPEQLTACDQLAEGDLCTAPDGDGTCYDGVCLPRGCGNEIVEDGEQCDDGNKVSGDGCSGDCRSTERCGNGVLDGDEQCDDGNLISHDDCSSACRIETPSWTSLWLAPSAIDNLAYDRARGRLVVSSGGTWELTDAGWEAHDASVEGALYYDDDRAAVAAISVHGGSVWDGTRWTQTIPASNPLDSEATAAATYDPANHRTILAAHSVGALYDIRAVSAAGVWSDIGLASGEITSMAFDPVTQQAVLLDNQQYRFWAVNGQTLTVRPLTGDYYTAMERSPAHQVFASAGALYLRNATTVARVMNATVTNLTTAAETALFPSATYYDTAHAAIGELTPTMWRRFDGSAWSTIGKVPEGSVAVSDAQDFIATSGSGDTNEPVVVWKLDEHATPIATSNSPAGQWGTHMIYAPGRRGTIALGGERVDICTDPESVDFGAPECSAIVAEVYDIRANTWAPLATHQLISDALALGYDPHARRVIADVNGRLSAFADDSDTWIDLGALGLQLPSFAFDARNQRFVSSTLRAFDADTLAMQTLSLAPVGPQFVLEDERSGGVLIAAFASTTQLPTLWGLRGDAYVAYPPPPKTPFVVSSAAYRARDGAAMFVGQGGLGFGAMVFRRTSDTPDETCAPGEDADGDGLASCDDPDCYWKCSGCPPYTTCRFDLTP